MLRGISRSANGGLDPRPMPGSPALSTLRETPNDGFYCNAPYKGAFDSVNWATDWTALSELCILTGAGGGVPMCMPFRRTGVEGNTPGAVSKWTVISYESSQKFRSSLNLKTSPATAANVTITSTTTPTTTDRHFTPVKNPTGSRGEGGVST
jgi:hypothetical protein